MIGTRAWRALMGRRLWWSEEEEQEQEEEQEEEEELGKTAALAAPAASRRYSTRYTRPLSALSHSTQRSGKTTSTKSERDTHFDS